MSERQRIAKWIALVAGLLLSGCSSVRLQWDAASVRRVYDPNGDFYCYAPTWVPTERGGFILACHNSEAGVIRDDIFFIQRNGTNVTATSVFKAGSAGAWDSFHVCDPSIVSGNFRFDGVSYRYAMFYLGNNVDASRNNQIGVAFANDWRGPWIRYPEPIVAHPQNGRWGAGQPSALFLRDKLLLFYTKGIPQTAGYVREVDLRDMANPRIGPEFRLSARGLFRANGAPDFWNNFEVAFDPWRKRLWALREKRPYPVDNPRHISERLEVLSLRARDLFKTNAVWRVEGEINAQLTGHPRNHNGCFARTLKGGLPERNRLRVMFSTSCAGEQCAGKFPLWTYDLWEAEARVARSR